MKRREAKALGLTTYKTGKPCPNGHVNPARKTHNGCCVECDRPLARKRAAKHNGSDLHKKQVTAYKSTPEGRASLSHSAAKRRAKSKVALTADETLRVKNLYQKRDLLNDLAGRIAYHIDHIHPISKGGTHHPDNLQIMRAEDNLKKSDQLHTAS